MADSQRQRFYDAEGMLRFAFSQPNGTYEFHGSTLVMPAERRFGRVEDVARYVEIVLGLDWMKREFKRASIPCQVRERRGNGKAHYEHDTHTIALCSKVPLGQAWAMREAVVLHEISHHLAGPVGHGPEFAGIFLGLISRFIGPEAALVLMAAYDDLGVVWIQRSI